ncbi:outer membrane protein with beta-barrel domain [Dyadobacter jejuensis]|uniref:Outer membrane protein with beta-barrel domain n=1 Tax=Dyadobacter jejuensis TaxID=1082580 RepID=A0A316ABU3_9BACT|nr:outer membrane beta-barrel protein [Dyadobacter jejuensis]PWJ55052.1 outer membrane protein with beta-barrel domain [Dyadobacter jejuensis]
MRKIAVILLIMGSISASMAQKNSVLLYGALDAHSIELAGGEKYNAFSISPGLGYQFTDHWTAGVNLAFSSNKYDYNNDKETSFGAGPFVRYAYPLSDIFAVYGQFNATVGSVDHNGVKATHYSGVLFPAIGVNMKNGFALNFNFGQLGYSNDKTKGENGTKNFVLSFGNGIGFGMSKNFGGK